MLDVSRHNEATQVGVGSSIMPLLDVMLLLLIFFLLTSIFVQPTLEVELPGAANSDPNIETHDRVAITVSREGEVLLNETPISLPDLQDHLTSVLAQDPKRPIVVRADQQSAFARFVSVMDAAKGAGATQIIIETRIDAGGEGNGG
jgi:biopolymer transport protein ExbD